MTMTTTPLHDNPLLAWGRDYYHDPVLFVREVLGVEPYQWQVQLMRNIARTWALPVNARTAKDRQHSARSGHRVGKSTVLGWLALWVLSTRYRCKVIITAPTKGQLFDGLMAEMKSWARKLPPDIQNLIEIKSDRIELRAAPEDAFIVAATSRAETPEALQGKHSDFVLLIGDEASGIPEAVFEASAGSMASKNAIMLLTSNPVRSSGYFFETHNQMVDEWTCYHIDSEEIETVDRVWIESMARKYGRESNEFGIRVKGNFPRADSNTIIPLHLVMDAIGRDIRDTGQEPQLWGMDVAREGEDASAITKRTPRRLLEWPRRYRNEDTAELAGRLKGEYDQAARKPEEIFIDLIGWGAGTVDSARAVGLPATGVNVSESTTIDKASATYLGAGYANLRSELWFKMREWLETKAVALPEMPPKGHPDYAIAQRFITELTMVRYKFTPTGKLLVESKESLRERKAGSPDMADALAVTFCDRAIYLSRAGIKKHKGPLRRHRPPRV